MLAKIADTASVLGLIISLAGLVYSIRAFSAANKARQSADEARRAVRTLVAADKFHHLNSKASALLSHVDHEDFPVAIFLARDL
jgi:uncharacterized membrane protein